MPLHKISGFDVSFPHQPYGVQFSYMSKMLTALQRQENALLEAPTGCGKTLSLLCSALAWQTKCKEAVEEWKVRFTEQLANQMEAVRLAKAAEAAADAAATQEFQPGCAAHNPTQSAGMPQFVRAGDLPNAAAPTGQPGTPVPSAAPLGHTGLAAGTSAAPPSPEVTEDDRPAVPRIYFATRTHSQIAQVVRELKRSGYKPRMAILAARTHYCINKTVKNSGRIDEECEALARDKFGCKFKKRGDTRQPPAGVQVHDIEELTESCTRSKQCPYFVSRTMAETAELVFCPYSYLLDPLVRAAMAINLKDTVVIFDEAHNIEDVARDAGSCDLDLVSLQMSCLTLERATELSSTPELYRPLADAVRTVTQWLEHTSSSDKLKPAGFEASEVMWSGNQLVEHLAEAGLTPASVVALQRDLDKAKANEGKATFGTEGEAVDKEIPPDMTNPGGGAALGTLGRLLAVCSMLYGQVPGSAVKVDRSGDYRVVVKKFTSRSHGSSNSRGGRGSRASVTSGPEEVVQLCIWCMNPAVVFEQVARPASSVVLTSGTLSPLDTFAAELGTAFHTTLEAPHVVDMKRQVWAGVVPCAPDGTLLRATFKEASSIKFQDGLGQAIVRCCTHIPDGVLLFLPSYSLMDKLSTRWKESGLWQQLLAVKEIVVEPRDAGRDFTSAMQKYYEAVAKGRGAIFIAICRGKASEGIDFADAHARAVLLVGIPFPSVKDSNVNLKKLYNDEVCRRQPQARHINGELWYSQQAFRALNQAIGRCIRHKYDYGAIVLLDERFRAPKNQQHLSRWVRGAITVQPSMDSAMASMGSFFSALAADPPCRPPPPADAAAPLAADGPRGDVSGEAPFGTVKDEDNAKARVTLIKQESCGKGGCCGGGVGGGEEPPVVPPSFKNMKQRTLIELAYESKLGGRTAGSGALDCCPAVTECGGGFAQRDEQVGGTCGSGGGGVGGDADGGGGDAGGLSGSANRWNSGDAGQAPGKGGDAPQQRAASSQQSFSFVKPEPMEHAVLGAADRLGATSHGLPPACQPSPTPGWQSGAATQAAVAGGRAAAPAPTASASSPFAQFHAKPLHPTERTHSRLPMWMKSKGQLEGPTPAANGSSQAITASQTPLLSAALPAPSPANSPLPQQTAAAQGASPVFLVGATTGTSPAGRAKRLTPRPGSGAGATKASRLCSPAPAGAAVSDGDTTTSLAPAWQAGHVAQQWQAGPPAGQQTGQQWQVAPHMWQAGQHTLPQQPQCTTDGPAQNVVPLPSHGDSHSASPLQASGGGGSSSGTGVRYLTVSCSVPRGGGGVLCPSNTTAVRRFVQCLAGLGVDLTEVEVAQGVAADVDACVAFLRSMHNLVEGSQRQAAMAGMLDFFDLVREKLQAGGLAVGGGGAEVITLGRSAWDCAPPHGFLVAMEAAAAEQDTATLIQLLQTTRDAYEQVFDELNGGEDFTRPVVLIAPASSRAPAHVAQPAAWTAQPPASLPSYHPPPPPLQHPSSTFDGHHQTCGAPQVHGEMQQQPQMRVQLQPQDQQQQHTQADQQATLARTLPLAPPTVASVIEGHSAAWYPAPQQMQHKQQQQQPPPAPVTYPHHPSHQQQHHPGHAQQYHPQQQWQQQQYTAAAQHASNQPPHQYNHLNLGKQHHQRHDVLPAAVARVVSPKPPAVISAAATITAAVSAGPATQAPVGFIDIGPLLFVPAAYCDGTAMDVVVVAQQGGAEELDCCSESAAASAAAASGTVDKQNAGLGGSSANEVSGGGGDGAMMGGRNMNGGGPLEGHADVAAAWSVDIDAYDNSGGGEEPWEVAAAAEGCVGSEEAFEDAAAAGVCGGGVKRKPPFSPEHPLDRPHRPVGGDCAPDQEVPPAQ